MILYFSATGNCEHVAAKLAKATNDRAISMTEINEEVCLEDNEALGIVTPTYYWGLPSYVDEFMMGIRFSGGRRSYIYYIATYGTTCGQTGIFMKRHLKNKGLNLNAAFSVKMPDNWTPVFDLSNKAKVAKINAKELPQIEAIISHIKNGDNGDFMTSKFPMFAVNVWKPIYEKNRKTSHLHVEDTCIGCGLCAKNCPVRAIEMKDKKPAWIKNKCVMCLRCLHHCPAFAIQYDNKTKKHGQYVHP